MKIKIIVIAILFGVVLILLGCSTTEFPTPTVSTADVTSVTEMTAVAGGIISTDNGSMISTRGVCWSISPNPTINDNKLEATGTGPGTFYCNLAGLNPITTYYVRAYATNAGGTAYGNQVTFTTKAFELTTIPPSFITAISAISGGMVSFDNDRPDAASRGVCWNEFPNPTTSDNKTLDGVGKGSFTSVMTGLKPFTTYYVRAYITNSEGTRYGNELSFSTQNGVIGIVTDAVSSITSTSATFSATISGDGGATITERGFCLSKVANPTNTDTKVVVGNGTGSITKEISGLNANTTYFVRAYATNSFGTVYGNEQIFTTLVGVPKACFEFASVVGYKVTISNCSDYPTTCLWDFGDGTTSTENEPTHVYTTLGTYNVKLTVTNDGLSDFVTKMITLNDEVSLNNIKPTLYPTTYANVDVDFDNVVDFAFSIVYQSHPISLFTYEASSISSFNGYEIFSDTVIVNQYYTPNLGNSINVTMVIPRIYSQGSTILNSTKTKIGYLSLCTYSYNGYGLSYRLGDWISNADRYVGFRKVVGDKTKIGWIKLQVADYASVTLRSFKIPTDGESLVIDK